MTKVSEKGYREAALARMREERAREEMAEQAGAEWPRTKAVLDRFAEVQRQAELPRVEVGPTPLRRWKMERGALFEKVAPAVEIDTFMHVEWISKCLTGEVPTAEDVAALARMAGDEVAISRMLASMSSLALPVKYFREDELQADETVGRRLLCEDARPADLATITHGAIMMECAAAHVDDQAAMGHLLAIAAVFWWSAGQPQRTARTVKVAGYAAPGWPLTDTMRIALQLRGKPEWMTI